MANTRAGDKERVRQILESVGVPKEVITILLKAPYELCELASLQDLDEATLTAEGVGKFPAKRILRRLRQEYEELFEDNEAGTIERRTLTLPKNLPMWESADRVHPVAFIQDLELQLQAACVAEEHFGPILKARIGEGPRQEQLRQAVTGKSWNEARDAFVEAARDEAAEQAATRRLVNMDSSRFPSLNKFSLSYMRTFKLAGKDPNNPSEVTLVGTRIEEALQPAFKSAMRVEKPTNVGAALELLLSIASDSRRRGRPERRVQLRKDKDEAKPKKPECFKCGSTEHFIRNCPKEKQETAKFAWLGMLEQDELTNFGDAYSQ